MLDRCVLAMTVCMTGLDTKAAFGAAERSGLSPIPRAIEGAEATTRRAVARALLGTMPVDVQSEIRATGAVGTDSLDHPGVGVLLLDTHYRSVAAWVSATEFARLDDQHLQLLVAMARSLEERKPVAAPCFGPGTSQETINIFTRLERAGTRYQQIRRWTSTATDAAVGGRGNPVTLTYSFVPDGTFIPDVSGFGLGSGPSQLHAWLDSLYGSQAVWKPYFDDAFATWGHVTGNTYIYEPNDDGVTMVNNTNPGVLGVRGDIRIGALDFQNDFVPSGNGGILAFNNYPPDGDMVFDAFDTTYQNQSNDSIIFRNVIAHEHGHGLGMLHVCPIDLTKLMEPNVTTTFLGPQLDDILNGQRYYGDAREPDDTPSEASSLGSIVPGTLVAPNEPLSIADDSDIDYFEFEVPTPAELAITVAPAAGAYLEGPQPVVGGTCTSGALVDFDIIHDLSIAILADDGATILEFSNATGAGTAEELVVELPAGSYFLEINGDKTNNIQLYQLTILASGLACGCADFDGSGTVNIDDIDAFVAAFLSGGLGADCDGNGTLNVDDIDTFVSAFLSGCP